MSCLVCRCDCKNFELLTQKVYEANKEMWIGDNPEPAEAEKYIHKLIKREVCRYCLHDCGDHNPGDQLLAFETRIKVQFI